MRPYRPNADVTQSFNDGLVTVYSVTDTAAAGYKPLETLTEKIKLPYEERRLGVQRYYAGRQNQIEVERVLRVPVGDERVTSQDIAVTEDGTRYRIDLVQLVTDVFPRCVDLTLVRWSQGVIPTS